MFVYGNRQAKGSGGTDVDGKLPDNSGDNVGENVGEILEALRHNNTQTTPQLAERLGVTTRTIERAIADMRKAGLIRRVGPAKGGRWEVLA